MCEGVKHKHDGMINLKNSKCIEEDCMIVPNFNLLNETKAIYCFTHKKENMINIREKIICIQERCIKLACCNISTETKAIYCKEHKKENMVNIRNKNNCIEELCDIYPLFNFSTETKPIYCSIHKKENMINIKSKRCIEDNCMKHRLFNFAKEKAPMFCSIHKKDKMINLVNKKCIEEGCNICPSFNIATKTKPIYCSEHKKENMVDVKHSICIEPNCTKRPTYNIPSDTKPIYCGEHKKDNMIYIHNNKCQSPKCKDTPIFGLLNKKPQFCLKHKQTNMINLVLENKCSVLDCNEEYINIIETTKYCNKHIPENALISVKRLCKFCDIKEESKHICKDCKKIQNKKEWAIVRYLRKAIDTKFEYNSSKMLQGCSKKRPDIYFELDRHCVIIEVDEHQHNTYGESCECARINKIVNGIGGKSVIIIRYNPDVVKNKDKKIDIKQCDRIDLLVNTIKEELVKDYETFIVKTIQIYYNDDYEEYKNIKEEEITDLVSI